MTLMDLIRKLSGKKAVTKQKYKEAEEDLRINKLLEERQKSSNRRELERYMKEKEEEQIKKALDKIRHEKTAESWSGKSSMMNQKMTILNNDRPILMEKNIFLDNKQEIPITNRGMFFKW
jgi:phosphopantetheinyl transferase (holo-ACP synthase)